MKHIGDAVDMDWRCNGSGANTQNDVASAFKNTFGYSSAKYMDFNGDKMLTELQAGRVVIMRGGRNVNGSYTNGHAWVVEGAKLAWSCNWDYKTGQIIAAYGYLYGYMNWGWSGLDNGYYQTNYLSNTGGSFNYKQGMVYDIRP
ncbi:C10 family peptidase [Chryseobacterium herbae]|uniref:C10 family peptidase n=1 Tax=Chryseobacterium herbae TaxID=2976476 RepID=A0ABT2ISU3_9FLAO|nr:C10 family peptidase [Chryseobacterium sp. pc1-10]MCT2561857.1 C10 family peptidase [Chryseobacterium sp. pc1-10]